MERRPQRMPEYRRVADDLRERIGKEFAIGDLLPSLPQLEAQYSVSTNVVRRALVDLQLVGLISTQHGVGSRVLAIPGKPGGSSPEEQEIMRLIGAMQQQLDELADQVAELRRERGLPPRPPGSPVESTSS